MPINTNLNIAPYFDDFDVEKQFYKILFKPAYAVQARELTQLQSILQNQVEQFGDNIYQEGTIIKGCNFTNLNGLEFVRLTDKTDFDVESYVSGPSTAIIDGLVTEVDVVYEVSNAAGLKANIIAATRGFETRPPDLNTFFINYLNTNGSIQRFQTGEALTITKYVYNGSVLVNALQEGGAGADPEIWTINVTLQNDPVGKSFGIRSSAGVIFQKGHFLFTKDQTLVVSKYNDQPDDLSVGYEVDELLVSALQDNTLYDNANGSQNENAPGADRLSMVPTLVVKDTAIADVDPVFFTLIRYQNGSAVTLRDVAQFNSIADEMAKRTYEESGNYVLENFKVDMDRRNNELTALVGKGTAYIKGFRVENSGKLDFAIDDVANTAIQPNQATTVDYGSYLNVVAISGTVDINYATVDLKNSVNGTIGKAYVKNLTPTRVYLMGVRMLLPNNFNEVVKIVGSSGEITVAANDKVKELNKSPVVFDTGTPYIKEFTDMVIPVRAQKAVTIVNDEIEITAAVGEDFALNQDDILVVDTTNTVISVVSVTLTLASSVMTIALDPGVASGGAEVYFNKRLTNAIPHPKTSVKPFIKVNFATATSKYSLGFPDVYKIISVNTGPGGVDFTDSFKLHTNQNDHYYDRSYMEYIQGRPQPANGQQLVVELAVYQRNTSQGQHFFNINSYPIDDDTAVLPDGFVRSSDLESYTATNGKIYQLRNCFDFRPYADKDSAVDYTDVSQGAAGIVTTPVSGTVSRTFTGTFLVPALESAITSDVESYLSRVDAIVFDSYGNSQIIKGEESQNPITPKVGTDQLVVSTVFIPGYPALSQKEASEQGKFSSAVQVKSAGTPNYTMRDIEKIEKRIEGLEYYISLNQLEQSSENLLILDENGLSRFKNGYIVDPMNDAGIANTDDPNHKAAIHFDKKILTPALNTFALDLKYSTAAGATIFPDINNAEVASLSRNANVKLIGQPYATNFRNCVSNFWKYDGNAQISPSHDMAHDTIQNPVPLEIDLAGVFQDLQEVMPITGTSWDGPITNGPSTSITSGRTTTTITPRSQAGTISSLTVNDGGLDQVGDFVTNVQFQPFMRSRNVKVFISGLRPNTQHYFFFDGVDVNAHVAGGNTDATDARTVQKVGERGGAVRTDSNGILRAVFRIPQGQFYVGDRVFTAVDVNQYSSIESASTSKGEITYHAYNITQNKTTIATRMPEFGTEETATSRNLASRMTQVTRRGDPLAQTFFIKQGMGRGSNSIFVSKVDLFFKRKSNINGVTITMREVINGYPSNIILPFSKTHLAPSEVSVSDDASAVTEVTFDAPIRMDVEKEYAVVIMPDANDPNYLHFTSKVGGDDLTAGPTQGQAVVMDWGDGVLFTSTNNRAWQSVQDEDIKFNLYRHDFNAATGSVSLTNDDHEFLTLSDWTGRFNINEFAYKQIDVGYSVSMVEGTSTITQSGNDFTADYAAGDYILVINSANTARDIFRIASVDSASEMTTDKPCSFNGATASGIPIVAGIISHYNKYTASELHLKQSSSIMSKKFVAGDTLTGLDSTTTGTIGSVDNINLSYVQPLIQKTNDSVTTTSINGTFTDPANVVNTYAMPMKFGDNNFFTQKGVVIYSRSNNFVNPKPFLINVEMTNASNSTSTPIVDLELATLLAYQFKVTNSATTTSKYISKTVELAEDLDAEDLNLYLTGYRPSGSEIKVYIRPQHAQDSSAADTIDWIELQIIEGLNTYSSSSNLDDFREYRYAVADANKDTDILTYTSDAGTFLGYRKFAIRIDLISDSIHNAPFVKDYRGIALT